MSLLCVYLKQIWEMQLGFAKYTVLGGAKLTFQVHDLVKGLPGNFGLPEGERTV